MSKPKDNDRQQEIEKRRWYYQMISSVEGAWAKWVLSPRHSLEEIERYYEAMCRNTVGY